VRGKTQNSKKVLVAIFLISHYVHSVHDQTLLRRKDKVSLCQFSLTSSRYNVKIPGSLVEAKDTSLAFYRN